MSTKPVLYYISIFCLGEGSSGRQAPALWVHACSALTLNEDHDQLHAPAPLPQGKSLRYPFNGGVGLPPVAGFDIVPRRPQLWNP